MTSRAAPLHDQDRIWRHYQDCEPELFAGAAPRLRFLVRWLTSRLRPTKSSVLNVGLGNALFEELAAARGFEVHTVDPDEQALQAARVFGGTAHPGRIEDMSFLADRRFDAVVVSEVLEHLDDLTRAAGVREVARVLKPGGWLLVTVPYEEPLDESVVYCPDCGKRFHRWGHVKSFDAAAVRRELLPVGPVVVLKRLAFPPVRGRSLGGKLKSIMRMALVRCGQSLHSASFFAAARRSGAPGLSTDNDD